MRWDRTNLIWGTKRWQKKADPWVSYLDPSYWTGTEDWDGEKYADVQTLILLPAGGWEVGFRPTQIRIAFTHLGFDPSAWMEGDPGAHIFHIGAHSANESPMLEDLVFTEPNNISLLRVYSSGGDFHVTGIWFYDNT
jgi:hypothetical protein